MLVTPLSGALLLRPLLLSLVLLSASAACGARQPTGRAPADRSVITLAQIQEHGFRNWLIERPDGLTTQREIQAYLDNSRLGGVQTLRQIATAQIASIRYIDAGTAINRWGVDHSHGVIMVISRK